MSELIQKNHFAAATLSDRLAKVFTDSRSCLLLATTSQPMRRRVNCPSDLTLTEYELRGSRRCSGNSCKRKQKHPFLTLSGSIPRILRGQSSVQ